ncbi:Protein transport protein SEC31, partial [Smittium culicis]
IEDVTDLSWNNQVQQILATSSNSGSTAVWDLRNRREVMNLAHSGNLGLDLNQGMSSSNGMSRSGVSAVKWHPNSPTQLVTSLDDDKTPVILAWDLRNAKSPTKFYSGHNRGILSLSWCLKDPSLLLSSGKDNRTICWNVDSGEIISELPTSNNWVFDVQWNQKNPNFLSTASFEGKISIYKTQPISKESQTTTFVEDPFDISNSQDLSQSLVLKSPPKWLSRPCGASFGFGNKLVSFNNSSSNVSCFQVVSDLELTNHALELNQKLQAGELESLCLDRMKEATDKLEIDEWKTLSLLFQPNAREKLIEMLGFDKSNLKTKVEKLLADLSSKNSEPEAIKEEPKKSKSKKSKKTKKTESENVDDAAEVHETPDATQEDDKEHTPFAADDSNSSDLFLKSISKDGDSLSESIADLSISETVSNNVDFSGSFSLQCSEQDTDDLISKSLMLGNIEDAVSICIENNRFADALVLASCSSPELTAKTQLAYFQKRGKSFPYVRLLYSIYSNDLTDIVRNSEIKEWPMVLSFICTYSQDTHFSHHCSQLGARLESAFAKSDDQDLMWGALLCYLVSGNVGKISLIWIKRHQKNEPISKNPTSLSSLKTISSLHKFVEKLSILIAAIDFVDPSVGSSSDSTSAGQKYLLSPLYDIYVDYAEFLVSQGLFTMCMDFLNRIPSDYTTKDSNGNDRVSALKYRLYKSGCVAWNGLSLPSPDFDLQTINAEITQAPAYNNTSAPVSTNNQYTHSAQNFYSQNTGYAQPPQAANSMANQNQFYNNKPPMHQPNHSHPPSNLNSYNQSQPQQQYNSFNPAMNSPHIPQIPKPQIQNISTDYNQTYQNTQPISPNTALGYPPNSYYNPNSGPSMISPSQSNINRAALNPPPVSMIPPPRPVNPQSIPTGATPPPQKEGAWNDPPMIAKPIKRSNPSVPKPPVISNPFPNGRSTPPLSQSSSNLAGSTQIDNSANKPYQQQPISSYNPNPPQFNQQQQFQQPPVYPTPNSGSMPTFGAQPQMQQTNMFNPALGLQGVQPAQPMATRGQVVAPPSAINNRASANVVQQAKSPNSQSSSNLKFPPGDRSHFPDYWKPVHAKLQALLEKCQKFTPNNQKRIIEDSNKRLQQLFDLMNNDAIPKAGANSEINTLFSNLISSIETRNYHSAHSDVTSIMSSSSDLTSSMLGVKRMIDILKSLPV